MIAKKSLLVALTLCSVAAGAALAQTKAPIDTVFAQGQINPYGKFFTAGSVKPRH